MTEEFPSEQVPGVVELDITQLSVELKSIAELYPQVGPELQERWYGVEAEARSGQNREAVKEHLQELIAKIREVAEKEGLAA